MYVDIGVYGPPKTKGFDAIPTTKRIEAYVMKVKGYVFLDGQSSFSTLYFFTSVSDYFSVISFRFLGCVAKTSTPNMPL